MGVGPTRSLPSLYLRGVPGGWLCKHDGVDKMHRDQGSASRMRVRVDKQSDIFQPPNNPGAEGPRVSSAAISHLHVPTLLRVVLSAAILAGICFRFFDLPKKIFFYDEIFTSVHSSGHTLAEYKATIKDDRIYSVSDLQEYQGAPPQRTISDVVYSLAQEDPQHPPLYYVIERLWTGTAENTIADRRSLSAVFGVLAIPAAAWLGFELFGSFLVAWLVAGMVAVSPFLVLYSQLAREYSAWSVLVMVSSALLIRALRSDRLWSWFAYGTCIAISLYVFTLFAYVIAAHAIFVLVANGPRVTRRAVAFVSSITVALIAFAPWIAVIVTHRNLVISETDFTSTALPVWLLLARTTFNVTSVFFDAEYRYGVLAVLVPLICFLIGAAAFHCAVRCPRLPRLFLFALIVVPALPLILEDILLHHSRSSATRYFVPTLVGIQLLVAYYLADRLANAGGRTARFLWSGAVIGVLCAGALSCVVSLPQPAWWPNIQDSDLGALTDAIKPYSRPLVLSDNPFLVLQLSDMVGSDVQFAITKPYEVGPIGSGQTLLISPSLQQLRLIGRMKAYSLKRLVLPPVPQDPFVANVRALFARARTRAMKSDVSFAEQRYSIWLLQPR